MKISNTLYTHHICYWYCLEAYGGNTANECLNVWLMFVHLYHTVQKKVKIRNEQRSGAPQQPQVSIWESDKTQENITREPRGQPFPFPR